MEATFEKKPQLLREAAKLQEQITVIQEQLQHLLHNAGTLQVTLPELHDEKSGRIDAQRLADYLGIPLKRLAEALDLNYKTTHRNPSAESLQATLRPIKRILEILQDFFRKPETVRVWLRTPHPDLGDSALETILHKKSAAVLTVLENAVAGVPI
jgi:uncharacterized protein (DUF2384 family)